MKSLLKVVAIFFTVLANTCAYGQQLAFKHISTYTQRDGVPGSNIRKILKDSNGFLWLITQDGIARFDGARFIDFGPGATDSKRVTNGSDFHDIVLDSSRSNLWVAGSNGPLQVIDIATATITASLSIFEDGNSNAYMPIYKLILSGNFLYAASTTGYIVEIDVRTLRVKKKVNIKKILPGVVPVLSTIQITAGGACWLFLDGYGIVVMNTEWSTIIKYLPVSQLFPGASPAQLIFNSTCNVEDHHILACTFAGIACIDVVKKVQCTAGDVFGQYAPLMAGKSVVGSFYYNANLFFSADDGFFQYNTRLHSLVKIMPAGVYETAGLLNNSYAIFTDGIALWVGTGEALAMMPLGRTPFTAFSQSSNASGVFIKHCYHLLAANDSIVYSCASDGLYQTNTSSGIIKKLAGGQAFYQLTKCPNGNLLVAAEKQLFVLNNTMLVKAADIYPELQAIKNDFIIASCNYKDSLIFLASQLGKGIYIWDVVHKKVSALTTTSSPAALLDAEINNLHIEAGETLGIVCKSVFSRYNFRTGQMENYFINDPLKKHSAQLLMDYCRVKNKYYFLAYGNGIIETSEDFKSTKLIGLSNGLTSYSLYKIIAIGDSVFFASSNDGLFYYNIKNAVLKRFGAAYGLTSEEFNETSGSSNGKYIYFGGLNGYTRVEPALLQTNTRAPGCWISTVSVKRDHNVVENYTSLYQQKISVENDYEQVNINFAGVLFPNPSEVRYSYRIIPLQKEWQSLGTQNFVNLVGLGKGTYQFEVKALNADGVASAPKFITLIFMPRWYETWWFTTLVVATSILFVCGIFLLRIRQLKREQNIRIKLAGDLHDDLGGTINSVKVYTNLAILEREPQKYLPLIKSAVQEAVTGIKDLIWVLDDKHNDIEDLVARIKTFAQPLCEASGISYITKMHENLHDRRLKREEKRALYMMIKEAVNNAVKYSGANTIVFMADEAGKKLLFTVTDDGKGFDVTSANTGNGIKNMHWRSSAIKYTCVFSSKENDGTTVTFKKN